MSVANNPPTSDYAPQPLPLGKKLKNTELHEQNNDLRNVEEVLKECRHLIQVGLAGTAAQQLAREAVFGERQMKKCTPQGSPTLRALPQSGLWKIKCIIFKETPQYWRDLYQYETVVWKKCHTSIEQACGRI